MKERQFDHIDNRIREAAENSLPEFDEQNWQKMKLLLDEENSRKRPAGWVVSSIIFCLLAVGYFFLTNQPSRKISKHTDELQKTSYASKLAEIAGDTIPVNEDKTSLGQKTQTHISNPQSKEYLLGKMPTTAVSDNRIAGIYKDNTGKVFRKKNRFIGKARMQINIATSRAVNDAEDISRSTKIDAETVAIKIDPEKVGTSVSAD
ncbi:MAG: hypothetical protein H7X88_12855, partial [Gloeobacteraceae cyanobacterium ES-bin-316]|nr:hypothetical protein [Ferruginibacter sp.]